MIALKTDILVKTTCVYVKHVSMYVVFACDRMWVCLCAYMHVCMYVYYKKHYILYCLRV